jgi:hypothetical protein
MKFKKRTQKIGVQALACFGWQWSSPQQCMKAAFQRASIMAASFCTLTAAESRGQSIAQQAFLKASNPAEFAQFGERVAISGDTVVVGCQNDSSAASVINGDQGDTSAPAAGAAYVFTQIGGVWTQQAYVKASNAEPGDRFGWSVAIDGDTLVVGAPMEKSSATGVGGDQTINTTDNHGAAYVFKRSGGVWTQQAYLKAGPTPAATSFGSAVAVSGSLIAVAALGDASNATGVNGSPANSSKPTSGAVYVFAETSPGVWAQEAYIKGSNPDSNDRFGRSIALNGSTLVVGADGEDSADIGNQANNSASDSGAAYAFFRNAGVWTQQAYLKASNIGGGDLFGLSVAVSGDTIAVGAHNEDGNGSGVNAPQNDLGFNSGAVYLFNRIAGVWSQHSYIKAGFNSTSSNFGQAVALDGDMLLVGQPSDRSPAIGVNGNAAATGAGASGAAYLFLRSFEGWSQAAYIKASNTGEGDLFGWTVGVSGSQFVCGAPNESSNAAGINGVQNNNNRTNSGAAYVFGPGDQVAGIGLIGLAKSGEEPQGLPGTKFKSLLESVINPEAEVLHTATLSGSGATQGRGRALFSSEGSPSQLNALIQTGADLAGLGAPFAGLKTSAFSSLVFNRKDQSLFQIVVKGPGVTSRNNRLLLTDDGFSPSVLRRLGDAEPALGGAFLSKFTEVTQCHDEDAVILSYRLRRDSGTGVDQSNDSGLLVMEHDGTVINASPRAGAAAHGGGGNFGLFTGRTAIGFGTLVYFSTAFLPDGGGKAVTGLFGDDIEGGDPSRVALLNEQAPGTSGLFWRSLVAFGQADDQAVFRATLKSTPSALNEGIWKGATLQLRKGDDIGGGVLVSRILRYWPIEGGQMVVLAQLKGAGVKSTNNNALLLRQADDNWLTLLRKGQQTPGAPESTILAIQAVDVNPVSGRYAVTASLKGGSKAQNQALVTGHTKAGDDTAGQSQRQPVLRLRKGVKYTTVNTPLGTVLGITLKPVADRTGIGGRGLGQVIGAGGDVVLTLATEQQRREVVVLEP